jgi:hypothetical protein
MVLIRVRKGVLQGGTLSPLLFCLYINDLLLELTEFLGLENILAYADDVALVFYTKDILARSIKIVERWCEKNFM